MREPRAPRPTVRICHRPECGEPPAFQVRSESGNLYGVCAAHLGVLLLSLPNGLPARVDAIPSPPEDEATARHEVPR
jgi:hypothetical protein